MNIIITTPELGTISWELPKQVQERIASTRKMWIEQGSVAFADKFEATLQEDITRFMTALSGSLTVALLMQNPRKTMKLIDERMKSLLLDVAKLAKAG